MVSNLILTAELAFVLLSLLIIKAFFLKAKTPRLPPGPKGLPLVGNILDMPSEKEWLTFAKWGELYGDLQRHYTPSKFWLFNL